MKLKEFAEKAQLLLDEHGPDIEVWIDLSSCCGCAPDDVLNIDIEKEYHIEHGERIWSSHVLVG